MNSKYMVNVTRLGDGFEFGQVIVPAEFPEAFGTQAAVDRLIGLNALIPVSDEVVEPTHDDKGFLILRVPNEGDEGEDGEGEKEVKIPMKTGEEVGKSDPDAKKVKGADDSAEADAAKAEIEKLTKAAKP